jgi:hexosaminidase
MTPSIIPEPVQMSVQSGTICLTSDSVIFYQPKLISLANYIIDLTHRAFGFKIQINEIPILDSVSLSGENNLYLTEDPTLNVPNSEGYILKITNNASSKGIFITGKTIQGVFYGVQTLRQLFPIEIESPLKVEGVTWSVPCVDILDYPRFPWRGLMVDEVRHFFGLTFIKRTIDLMALHKLNKLHWHLTDDEGWRIESKVYPKLNTTGCTRLVSKKWNEEFNTDDPMYYGGQYTQEEIKEVIAYAADRFIEVIPEIEMPGHATAPLVAYPEFSCEKPPSIVQTIGVGNKLRYAYCAGYPPTYEFLQNVLKETISLFPTDHIHIGGDELPENRWHECSRCQSFLKQNNLRDLDELQIHFAAENIRFLQTQNKTAIGWFDFSVEKLLEKKIDPQKLIFQFWVGSEQKVVTFIRKGGKAIISNHQFCYLDYHHSNITLKKAYNFDPIPSELEPSMHERVLGIEAPIWTERVPNLHRMDFQVFPRLCAYAETAWSPIMKKNYSNFRQRLQLLLLRLDHLNVYYAPLFIAEFSWKAHLLPKSHL